MVEIKQRRQHPRLRCFGSSVLLLPGVEFTRNATIVDLSLAGCRLITKQACPLELGTIVELTFEVNQLPFRVRACLRAPRSEVELGFAFVTLSKRSRHRIMDLVEELTQDRLRQTRAAHNFSVA